MEMNLGNIGESKESGQEALSKSLKSKDFERSDGFSAGLPFCLRMDIPKRKEGKDEAGNC
jgi:hypothetical protein